MIRLIARLLLRRPKPRDMPMRDPLFMFSAPPAIDLHPRGGL